MSESRSSSQTQYTEGEKTKRRGRSPSPDGREHKRRDKSITQKFKDLGARINIVNTNVNAPVTADTLIKQIEPPFTERVMKVRVLSRFKLPSQLKVYEGKTDPMDHLDSYENLIMLRGYADEAMCKAFLATLKGPTRSWSRKFSPNISDSFGLSRLVANFMSYTVR